MSVPGTNQTLTHHQVVYNRKDNKFVRFAVLLLLVLLFGLVLNLYSKVEELQKTIEESKTRAEPEGQEGVCNSELEKMRNELNEIKRMLQQKTSYEDTPKENMPGFEKVKKAFKDIELDRLMKEYMRKVGNFFRFSKEL